MNNEEMRPRMENLKALLEGIVSRIEALPQEPEWDDMMERGDHLRIFHDLFTKEHDLYIKSVGPKDRSMEVLALIGFIEMSIRETGKKLVAMRDAIRKKQPQPETTGHPLMDLIRGLQKDGGVDVAVVDLRPKDEEACNNPNCPIHGKGENKPKVEGNN